MSARVNDISDRREVPDVSGVVDAAREVALRRRAKLLDLKDARMRESIEEVFKIIDELVPDGVLNSHNEEKVVSITQHASKLGD